ncbi:MAG: 23S rRNA (guanosine(2251)-2'-O)-methyltransferase RlmB [Bacteroidales bacterium]|nr:23S rRNA (guanosine(2251)-2'-O)-methyltransferase RlmB [Bacteroidales bacterium]
MADNTMVFGTRAVIEAVDARKEINKVLVRKGLDNDLARSLTKLLRDREIPFQYVPEQKLNRISQKNHQGVIAFISPVTYYSIEDIVPQLFEDGKNPFLLLLDGMSDVRNFGAVARTAECAGVDAIILPTKGSVQVTADSIKTSAGALHTMPVCRESNLDKTIEFLQQSGILVVAATEKTNELIYDLDLSIPVCIVMGAEDIGVSEIILRKADKLAQIPILGKISSLNVSVAASVFMYELVRQRRGRS